VSSWLVKPGAVDTFNSHVVFCTESLRDKKSWLAALPIRNSFLRGRDNKWRLFGNNLFLTQLLKVVVSIDHPSYRSESTTMTCWSFLRWEEEILLVTAAVARKKGYPVLVAGPCLFLFTASLSSPEWCHHMKSIAKLVACWSATLTLCDLPSHQFFVFNIIYPVESKTRVSRTTSLPISLEPDSHSYNTHWQVAHLFFFFPRSRSSWCTFPFPVRLHVHHWILPHRFSIALQSKSLNICIPTPIRFSELPTDITRSYEHGDWSDQHDALLHLSIASCCQHLPSTRIPRQPSPHQAFNLFSGDT
jgi:hypothetical protein